MVTLNKLRRIDNIISAEYFPEDDIDKGEIVKFEYCKRDKDSFLKSYLKKAVKAIEKCVEKDDYPETVVYAWY